MTVLPAQTISSSPEPEINDQVCIGRDAFRGSNADKSVSCAFGKVAEIEMFDGRRTGAYVIEYVIDKVAKRDRFWRGQFILGA